MKTLGDFLRRVVAGGAWTDEEVAQVHELAVRLDGNDLATLVPAPEREEAVRGDGPFVVGGPTSTSTGQDATPEPQPES